jgi:uncharacterized membrane protein YgcG
MNSAVRTVSLLVGLSAGLAAGFPVAQGSVTDQEGVLDPQTRAELATQLRDLRKPVRDDQRVTRGRVV